MKTPISLIVIIILCFAIIVLAMVPRIQKKQPKISVPIPFKYIGATQKEFTIQKGKMYRIDEAKIRNASVIVHAEDVPNMLGKLMNKPEFTGVTITQVGVVAIDKRSGVKSWVDPTLKLNCPLQLPSRYTLDIPSATERRNNFERKTN